MSHDMLNAIGKAAVGRAYFYSDKVKRNDMRRGTMFSAVAGFKLPEGTVLVAVKSPSHMDRNEAAVDAFIADVAKKKVAYKVTEAGDRKTTSQDTEPRLEYYLEDPKSSK